MKKIYIVYKFTNTITGDFYIGSQSIKIRYANHKYQSVWIAIPNDQLCQDMNKYGDDKFAFEILAEVEAEQLKETEQQFIEALKPTYNQMNEKDLDIESKEEYQKPNKGKESHRKSQNKYNNQLCLYEGKTLTLCALASRFRKAGIDHPFIEAKKYLIKEEAKTPIEFYDVYP